MSLIAEITTEKAIGLLGALFLFYSGVSSILNAAKLRQFALQGYEKHRVLYTALFFGEWIARRPRLHIWLIRAGGLFSILLGAVLFFAMMLTA